MMKHIYILTLITVVTFMSSCRKERDCKCTSTITNTSNGTSVSTSNTESTGKLTKKEAKTLCESENGSYTTGGYEYDYSCELE